MKKAISVLLCLCLVLSVFTVVPFAASAAEVTEETVGASSGTTGDCTWTLDDNGVLTISGNGNMGDYSDKYNSTLKRYVTTAPWGTDIKTVIIEDGVTSIGKYAFYNCTGLTNVTIPDSVTSIGSYAFFGCTGLTSVHITDIAAWCNIAFSISYSNPLSYAHNLYLNGVPVTNLVIPDGVTSIGSYAFRRCTGLTSVTIPDSVTSIGGYAFYNCTGLTSVTIGNSVTSIGGYAFSECIGLTSVTIPDSVTSIRGYAFEYCTGLKSVTIPDSVTSIGDCTFHRCTGLKSVTIPDSVTSIGSWAFSDCTGLTSLTIGKGVTSNGESAFEGCTGLTSVSIDAANSVYDSRENCNAVIKTSTNTLVLGCKTTVIPDSVTSIGHSAFEGCTGLTRITIPDSVTSIGSDAFSKCTGLTGINITDIAAWCSISFNNASSNPLYYAHNLYLNNELVTDLVIPDSVTSIGSWAFSDCTGLTSLTIGKGVTSIGDYAFYWCRGLTSVTIPDSVTSIGEQAFCDCAGLRSVTIPDSVTSIGREAFDDCTLLISVTIPENVTSIGKYAFSSCTGLTSVSVDAANSVYDSRENCNAIIETSTNTLILGCKTTVIPDSVTSIGDYAFCWCTSVTIPDSVKSIGSYAFRDCTGLTSVTIGNSVTSIGSSAFEDCTSLKDVYYIGTEDDWNRISIKNGNNYLLNASIHFRDKGGYVGNNAHDYSRFYDFSYSDDIWTAPHKDGTVPVEMDLGLYQDKGKLTKMDIKWSYSMFGKSSHIADNDLAIASLVLSANAYDRGRQRKTLEDLGFSKIEFYNDTGYDDINRVENVIASTVQPINGKQTNVIVIACRGSVNLQDWVSNINQQAQGFRFAAEDIKNDLLDYIETRHINTSMPTKILLTGHSRGAAAANILASIIPSDIAKKSDIFTYTFACPNTTNDAGRENYPIFNILNSGDPVTQLPIIYDACPKFGAYNIWFDKATAKDFNSYFTAVTGLNDVTYILDFPLAWCNGTFGNQYMYPFRHHSLALYLAFLLGEGIENNNSPNFNKKRISIECPVNVSVYDSTGQLLGTIKDNVADDALLANGIIPVIDGDKKYLYMTSNRDISLQLTGSDSGQMKYTVQDIDLNTGKVSEQGEFSSVALENGKTMTSAVASDIAVKDTQLYVSDGDSVLKKVSDNGEESDVVMISFDTGAGEKLRDMAAKKGDVPGELPIATLEGYGFDGWYRDKECTEAFDETQALNESITLYAAFYQSQTAYAGFTDMSYDGSKLEAGVKFEYNHLNGQLAAVLYKDDNILACSFTSVTDSDSTANFSFSVTGLSGLYELKLFCINNKGQFEHAGKTAGYDVSFYSDFLYSGNNYRRETVGDKALSLVKDGNIIVPESLNVNGQTFDGWYFDEAFMTKFDFDATDIKDTTLYAKWNMGLIGDVNGDNKVDITDATAIQRHLAEMESLSGQALALADVNSDGKVDISDATHLQMYLAEFDGIVLGKQN